MKRSTHLHAKAFRVDQVAKGEPGFVKLVFSAAPDEERYQVAVTLAADGAVKLWDELGKLSLP